jgi:hypothetical protein
MTGQRIKGIAATGEGVMAVGKLIADIGNALSDTDTNRQRDGRLRGKVLTRREQGLEWKRRTS